MWSADEHRLGNHCITASTGVWESPAFPVSPLRYYLVSFAARAEGIGGVWAIVYYDQHDTPLIADNYFEVDPSDDWVMREFCVRANDAATSARLKFQPARQIAVSIDDLTVTSVTREEAAQWIDRVTANMPPISYAPPTERWQCLPRTMDRLRKGGGLRIVMLGDSIINDTSNSIFETLLMRAYPQADIEVITSVRSATGCDFYQRPGMVQEYVLEYNPDLLIIGGISTKDVESIREVVKQVRAAATPPEIMLFTPVVQHRDDPETGKPWSLTIDPAGAGYRDRQLRIAQELGLEFVDFAGPFAQYAVSMGKPYAWLKRDQTHAGVRGKVVLGQMIARYLSPDAQ